MGRFEPWSYSKLSPKHLEKKTVDIIVTFSLHGPAAPHLRCIIGMREHLSVPAN